MPRIGESSLHVRVTENGRRRSVQYRTASLPSGSRRRHDVDRASGGRHHAGGQATPQSWANLRTSSVPRGTAGGAGSPRQEKSIRSAPDALIAQGNLTIIRCRSVGLTKCKSAANDSYNLMVLIASGRVEAQRSPGPPAFVGCICGLGGSPHGHSPRNRHPANSIPAEVIGGSRTAIPTAQASRTADGQRNRVRA